MRKYFLGSLLVLSIFLVINQAQDKTESDLTFFEEISKQGNWQFDAYEIFLNFMQPVDHNNPDGQKFTQRVYIRHIDFSKPVVVHTRGYNARPGTRKTELARILDCNEVEVEHRFFPPSIPENPDWKNLNIEQAAGDLHSIIQWLKKFYKGKFIATGGSKDGQTSLYQEYFYPEDNDVIVAYVAPITLEMEDSRIWTFIFDSISTAENRAKIIKYQRALLERREEIKPFVLKEIEESGDSLLGDYELCFEHAVMEFNFSWWQYGSGDISEIPEPSVSPEELYKPFVGNITFFLGNARSKFNAFNYQAYTQVGFYCYDTTPFKDLLIAAKDECSSNKPLFFDKLWNEPYDPEPHKKVHDFLVNKAEQVIYIYGGNDPWTAPGIWPSGKTSSFRMTKPGGNHGTNILDFEGDERERILTALEKWLEVKIDRKKIARLR